MPVPDEPAPFVRPLTPHEQRMRQMKRATDEQAAEFKDVVAAVYAVPPPQIGTDAAWRTFAAKAEAALLAAADTTGRPAIAADGLPRFAGFLDPGTGLVRGLGPADAGRFWIVVDGAACCFYLWTGSAYRAIGLPAPARVEHPVSWGGEVVTTGPPAAPSRSPTAAQRPPITKVAEPAEGPARTVPTRMYVAAVVLFIVHVALTGLNVANMLANGPDGVGVAAVAVNVAGAIFQGYRVRGYRAGQPKRPKPARPREFPVTPFAAACPCPACGHIDTHWLAEPTDDTTGALVVRECRECGQVWGQQ